MRRRAGPAADVRGYVARTRSHKRWPNGLPRRIGAKNCSATATLRHMLALTRPGLSLPNGLAKGPGEHGGAEDRGRRAHPARPPGRCSGPERRAAVFGVRLIANRGARGTEFDAADGVQGPAKP